jgi:broad specificity phosphatase PhoE
MKLYFVRHGESQANLKHEIANRGLVYGLTPNGRKQASALARKLRNQGLTRIYSSPILRAVETSILVANQLNLDYEITDALREYDCGFLEGRSDEVSWQRWQELFEAWTIHKVWEKSIEGGESFLDIQNRFIPFIHNLINQYGDTDSRILCVAHGGIYRLMLPLVLRNIDEETVNSYGIDYTTCIISELRPEGLCCVEWDRNHFG